MLSWMEVTQTSSDSKGSAKIQALNEEGSYNVEGFNMLKECQKVGFQREVRCLTTVYHISRSQINTLLE